MILLHAPAKSPVALTMLPNPTFTDSEGLDSKVNYRQSMTGIQYTYISKSLRRKMLLTFNNLARDKINELIEFIRTYNADLIRVTTHNSEVWDMHLTVDPTEFEIDARAQLIGGERGVVNLEFVGVQVS